MNRYDEVIEDLENIILSGNLGPEDEERFEKAVDEAVDSVKFANRTSEFLVNSYRVREDEILSYDRMSKELERLNNELSGAIAFISSLDDNIITHLNTAAESVEKHSQDKEVGETVASAYRAIADKIKNIKLFQKTKKKFKK